MFEKRSNGFITSRRLPVFFSIIVALLFSGIFSSGASAGVYTEVREGESVILTVPYQIKRYSLTEPPKEGSSQTGATAKVSQQPNQSGDAKSASQVIEQEPKGPALVQIIYVVPDKPGAGAFTNVSNPPGIPGQTGGAGKTEIKIDGQYPGKATLIVWDKDDQKQFFDINVVVDTTDLKARIDEVAKDDAPNVHLKTLKNALIVSGSVSTYERKHRIDDVLSSVAHSAGTPDEIAYLQGGQTISTSKNGDPNDKTIRYVNLLEVANAPEIDLQITVASIDRNALRDLGINWAYASRNLTIDTAISSVSGGLTDIPKLLSGTKSGGLETSGINGANVGVVHSPSGTQFLIKALASKGLARVLAEPDLLVKDGEVGTFLAGGEFPVPIVQNASSGSAISISVEWKKFGVIMNMMPLVKEDGNIEINMENNKKRNRTVGNGDESCGIEVSSLDFANAVTLQGFKIPALKVDRINTNVELKDGETFVVGGLINEEWTKNIDKVPLLGDIPIIGAFFRDQKLTRNERELVFFVTPKLAKAMPQGTKPAIPGADEPTKEQDNAFRFIPMLPNSIAIDPLKLK